MSVPVADAELPRAERSVRILLQCRGCGAAITVTVDNCGQGPPKDAEPERIEEVADLTAAVAGVIRREGPIYTRKIFRRIRARHSDILDVLKTLEASGIAAFTLGPRGRYLWVALDGRDG